MQGTQKQLDLIAALLGEETTLSLATAGNGNEPCIAPLFYIVDKELSLYWLSSGDSLHSRNLSSTPRATIAVYRDAAGWKQICGVQMRGAVEIVAAPRRTPLVEAYCERFKLGTVFRLAIRQSILYRFQPNFIRFIDNARGFGYKFELTRKLEGWTLSRPAD